MSIPSDRPRSIAVGIASGVAVLVLQAIGVRLLPDVPAGTRAQALGVCVATLAMFLVALPVGAQARLRFGARAREEGPVGIIPWSSVAAMAVAVAFGGVLMLQIDAVAHVMTGGLGMGAGTVGRALAAVNQIAIAAAILGAIGATLGVNGTGRWYLAIPVGLAGLVALQIAGGLISVRVSYDPDIVNIAVVVASVVSLLLVGFLLAFVLKRLAFVELASVAILFGFVLFLTAATAGKDLLAASNIPKEQILVVMAVGPTVAALALMAVGASVGFLLTGGGSLDTRFSYEAGVARRYLGAHTSRKNLVVLTIALMFLPVVLVLAVPWALIKLASMVIGGKTSPSKNPVGIILIISVAGVALGVMALVVVLSVMSGFENDLKTKILGAHAHVIINKKGDDFTEYADVEATAASVRGVKNAAAFVLGEGMISSESGLSGTLVKGIDPGNPSAIAYLKKNMQSGRIEWLLDPSGIPVSGRPVTLTSTAPENGQPTLREPSFGGQGGFRPGKVLPGVIIGRELAKTLRVRVGQSLNVVSPTSEELGPTGPQPKLRRFRVAGVFFSGMYEFDSKFAYVHMTQAQRFFGMRNKATGVELRVEDIDDTTLISEELKRRIGGYPYAVKDWRMMNKELFSALLLEKLAMFIILTFIVLVASFNIVSTLVMIVLEKGREIAILKSMGASEASIMKIFVVQGLIVGVGGALLGLTIGVGICTFLDVFGLPLDPDVFYIDRLPVVMDSGEIALIGVAAVIITYLATIYPAMAAAQLRPVEGLRDD